MRTGDKAGQSAGAISILVFYQQIAPHSKSSLLKS